MATFGGALLRAMLSFAYWSLVLVLFYGAVAGDRRVGAAPPTAWDVYAVPIAIIVVAILVHAGLNITWQARTRTGSR